MTVNVKNNRDESLNGNITFNANVQYNGLPSATATLAASPTHFIPVYDASGTLLGYTKVYPLS